MLTGGLTQRCQVNLPWNCSSITEILKPSLIESKNILIILHASLNKQQQYKEDSIINTLTWVSDLSRLDINFLPPMPQPPPSEYFDPLFERIEFGRQEEEEEERRRVMQEEDKKAQLEKEKQNQSLIDQENEWLKNRQTAARSKQAQREKQQKEKQQQQQQQGWNKAS
ncbi:MAG: hypothetical protein EZS28_021868 [Streblomastix strix]|uniref:Uncharacterized protein n=1 Tax=Streblomastix strix TaxID=222440 RepID=A0A5J4VJJ3_9EUKA|nr:MAG: hypothetical protein EZS28_021868 [Streblomastix strix]